MQKGPIIAAAVLLTVLTSILSAASVTISPSLYGHLDQEGSGVCGSGAFACVPVATANSFLMLDRKYGSNLIADKNSDGIIDNDEIAQVATTLSTYMECDPNVGGTYSNKVRPAKERYLTEHAPGMYYVHEKQWPTFNWLFAELTKGQDIEIFLGRYNGAGNRLSGHAVTLFGITGTDLDMDNYLDSGASLDFIDPSGGRDVSRSLSNDYMSLLVNNYETDPSVAIVRIEWAFAESPVPEPGTMLLMLAAAPALLWMRRRR